MKKFWESETENFIFFWGGIFSNWARAPFVAPLENDGEQYQFNCSEQYMMAQKAIVFNDKEILESIMNTSDPSIQKSLGRVVKNFDVEKWQKVARDLTYIGCYYKFKQDEELKEIILSTGNKIIVEASPLDKIWGVGLSHIDNKIEDKSRWRGKNWLGQVLMKVRDDIRNNEFNGFKEIDWTKYE